MRDPLRARNILVQQRLLDLVALAALVAEKALNSGAEIPNSALTVLNNFAPKIEPKTFLENEGMPSGYTAEIDRMVGVMAIEDAAKVQLAQARGTLLSGLAPATVDERKMIDVSPSDEDKLWREAMS